MRDAPPAGGILGKMRLFAALVFVWGFGAQRGARILRGLLVSGALGVSMQPIGAVWLSWSLPGIKAVLPGGFGLFVAFPPVSKIPYPFAPGFVAARF